MTAVASAVLFRSESKGSRFNANERPKYIPEIPNMTANAVHTYKTILSQEKPWHP